VRFEREVRATTELTHPNTVRVFDYGITEDGLLYYAMELLVGKDLGALIAETGPLAPERAVYLLHQATRALAEAHARGIVHRDVKPENLFVGAAGAEGDFVKVLDFGVARRDEAASDMKLTAHDAVVGTPRYMAPEVILGAHATFRSDVYALGAVLYFALTGRPPFDGPTNVALVAEIASTTEAPRLAAGRGSPELAALVARALAKDPLARFEHAAALSEAIAGLPEIGRHRPPLANLAQDQGATEPSLTATPAPLHNPPTEVQTVTRPIAVLPTDAKS
jgi:serine/threonine-protein kinase